MFTNDKAAEAILIAGGGRAILLQLANPAIGHGVAHHSDFTNRPLDRLHATLTYVYAVSCGTPEELRAVRRRVNRAHAPVRSAPTDADSEASAEHPAYNAFTPELQLWVAATLYDSAVTVHNRVFGPLSDDEADGMYRDYAALGSELQVPQSLWPADRAAFADYWTDQLSRLRTDATTRNVATQLLHPRTGPFWLRAAMPVGRLLTAGFLPPELREAFELRWTRRDQKRFDRLMRVSSVVYPVLPRAIRHWPKNHYLRALRASMA
ncbi:oxygenase MpaB family protein [Leifsonia kafniensis]|uniref:Oxygenase MpaB family protein n=1 Tax=Leifsonia kafniensis TaxID=475957 RepID=A0ABP7K6G1_9MICO